MRIAFVVGAFPKLSQTFILSQITGLIDCGCEVDIYAKKKHYKKTKLHADIESYKLEERTFQIASIPKHSILRIARGLLSWAAVAIKNPARGLQLIKLSNVGLKYKVDACIYSAMPALKDKPYDIIHCHFAEHSRDALLIQSVSSPKAKVVTTFHGYDVNVTTSRCNSETYREIFKKGDLFTANTAFTASKAALLGCPSDKIKILPVGLDTSRYSFSPRSLQAGKPINIVTVGRLVEKKGIEYSIRAVSETTQKRPDLDIHYKIVGEGPKRQSLESLVVELGLSEKITFLGEMTAAEVQAVYKQSHLFILSSVTAKNGDMEGQALVLQEAQCVGMPVISTLHNGIPDGVLDGESGFLVPERDVSALAERIIYLADHSQIWEKIGKCGHNFVKSRYEIQHLNEKLVQTYKSLLPEPI